MSSITSFFKDSISVNTSETRLATGLLFLRFFGALALLRTHGLPKALDIKSTMEHIPDPIGMGATFATYYAIFANVLCVPIHYGRSWHALGCFGDTFNYFKWVISGACRRSCEGARHSAYLFHCIYHSCHFRIGEILCGCASSKEIKRMKTQLFFIILAIIAGAVLPLQAGLNVQLGKSVHQPIFAAFASFLIGTVGLLVYLIVLKFDFGTIAQTKTVSPVVWIAGILGAFYVAAVIILAPRLGVALTFVLVVAGQMAVSLLVDHYGLLGLPVKQINWQRLVGVLLLIGGVLMIRRF